MINNNLAFYSAKIMGEIGRDILMFPVWWYTRGLVQLLGGLREFLANREKSLALLVWIKNIAKPMYAQTDWQGRLISFFMRLIQIIFRSLALLFYVVLTIFVTAVWLVLPLFVTYEIFFQING